MSEDTISSETLPDGESVTPADGRETGSLTLAELNENLGKNFKDPESAFKHLKDQESYVGQARNINPLIDKLKEKYGSLDKVVETLNSMADQPVEQPKTDPMAEVAALKLQVAESDFYVENPDLKPYRETIRKLGSDPAMVMADESSKTIIQKMKVADESTNSRSVLESNPRLGQVTDKSKKAFEYQNEASRALQAGDLVGASQNQMAANEQAVSAVLDAYES